MAFVFLAAAVLFVIYGICVMMLNSGSRFYAMWFALGIFMLLNALAFTGRFPPAFRRFLLIVLCMLVAFVAVTWGCILSTFHSTGEKGMDYIIVLGAQVRSTGPSAVLRYRLDIACDYLEANPETICVVTGGQGYNEPETEAAVMKDYLVKKGIAEERILTESQSENTVQNLVNSGGLIDLSGSVGVVTNNFHVFRAVHIARKNGYQNACGIAAPSNAFYLPNNMLRESFGILKDLLMGNM